MKHLYPRDELVSSECAFARRANPQKQFLDRAFFRAHGQPTGVLSTLTEDRRLHVQTKSRGAPGA